MRYIACFLLLTTIDLGSVSAQAGLAPAALNVVWISPHRLQPTTQAHTVFGLHVETMIVAGESATDVAARLDRGFASKRLVIVCDDLPHDYVKSLASTKRDQWAVIQLPGG